MARRHIPGREQWNTAQLQNLVGNHPRRWERTGRVVECKNYDQYLVKVYGTGRTTLRKRKPLRKFKPIPKHSMLPAPQPGQPTTPTTPAQPLSL
jgi:hypothetical protein